MNSQKRYIDVWLIYRCMNCDTTYNLTILSRTRPESIDKDIYHKFMCNDEELARTYAFDSGIMNKNNVTLDFNNIEYSICKGDFNIESITNTDEDIIEFEIKTDFNLPLKINQLIRHCLGISLKKLEQLISSDSITILPVGTHSNHKIKNGIIVRIEKDIL